MPYLLLSPDELGGRIVEVKVDKVANGFNLLVFERRPKVSVSSSSLSENNCQLSADGYCTRPSHLAPGKSRVVCRPSRSTSPV